MTREEALELLAGHGLSREDAETALDAALLALVDNAYDVFSAVAKDATTEELLEWFGQDGGRAVIILGQKT